MDYRCPICRVDLGRRKFSQAVITRMEIECSYCKSMIRLNVHQAETITVLVIFGAIVALGAFAYWFQSGGLVLLTVGAVMGGALALPLVEHTYLRSWPRYASIDKSPKR
jgi:hypothetical protein